MEYRELTEQIKNGKLSPLYFLFGEEPFFIQKAIRAIIETGTDPETRDFNCDVLQGEACEGEMLVQIASSFPMMSEKRVVVLKSVQKLSSSDRKQLIGYVENPLESTCLVLTAGKIDRRKSFYASLTKHAAWIECKPLYENQALSWVERSMHDSGVSLSREGALFLVQQTGTALWALSNEIEKLCTFAWGKKSLSLEDVVQVVGFSRKYNSWEFTDAVGYKRIKTAMTILHHLIDEGQSAVGLIMDLTRRFFILLRIRDLMASNKSTAYVSEALGLRPYFAKMYIEQAGQYTLGELKCTLLSLTEADCRIKTGYMDSPMVMTLLIRNIIKGAAR